MIDKDRFHIFNYIKKEEYTGSMDGMRYMLRKMEDGEDKYLEAIIWPQPYCYAKTAEEMKQRMRFSFNEEGLGEAADWLNKQYADQKKIWKINII